MVRPFAVYQTQYSTGVKVPQPWRLEVQVRRALGVECDERDECDDFNDGKETASSAESTRAADAALGVGIPFWLMKFKGRPLFSLTKSRGGHPFS